MEVRETFSQLCPYNIDDLDISFCLVFQKKKKCGSKKCASCAKWDEDISERALSFHFHLQTKDQWISKIWNICTYKNTLSFERISPHCVQAVSVLSRTLHSLSETREWELHLAKFCQKPKNRFERFSVLFPFFKSTSMGAVKTQYKH